MKYFLFLLILPASRAGAQSTTGRIAWKDVSGYSYNYIGELQNGKPQGKGYAVSADKGICLFGDFNKGLINGKATMIYNDGRVLTGQWKNGYANGLCVFIKSESQLFYGNYINGELNGKTTEIYGRFIQFAEKHGEQNNGRAITIFENGTTLVDCYFVDGIRSGPGYRYDAEKKTMEEALWKEGYLSQTVTGNYPSFMRNKTFGSSITDQGIRIWSDIANEKMQDTGYYFNRYTNKRYFGYFKNGMLVKGVKVEADTINVIGQWDENGLQGSCFYLKKGKGLYFGNYKNGKIDGEGINILFHPLQIIDGNFSDNKPAGKTSILKDNGTFSKVNFDNDGLNGELVEVFEDGSSKRTVYKNGEPSLADEVVTAADEKMFPKPKDVCTAINFLVKEFDNGFSNIASLRKFNPDQLPEDDPFATENPTTDYKSLYYFPGAIVNKVYQAYKQKGFYFGIAVSQDYAVIKKKYDELCRQLASCNITSLQKGRNMKLAGKITPAQSKTGGITTFYVPAYAGKTRTPKIVVILEYAGTWQLTGRIISYQDID